MCCDNTVVDIFVAAATAIVVESIAFTAAVVVYVAVAAESEIPK